MMCTKTLTAALAGLCIAILGAGVKGQSAGRKVHLEFRLAQAGDEHWLVDLRDDKLVGINLNKSDRNRVSTPRNFNASSKLPAVCGKYFSYDSKGGTKSVFPADRSGEKTEWDMEGGRFGMRLRVRNGVFKGWWVGLGQESRTEDGKVVINQLVLVEDRNSAITFFWPDPADHGK